MNLSNIVTFDILSYYDGKIKNWVSNTAITNKAGKVTVGTGEGQATAGNFFAISSSGDLEDSGYSPSSFQVAGSYKTTQTAVTSPTASGNTTSFIDTISQNTNGVITATKKTIPTVTASTNGTGGNDGLMTATLAEQLAGLVSTGGEVNILEGVQVNSTDLTITSKKVNITIAESSNNGKITVNGSDIAIHGLGSAAYTASTAYDAAGAASAVIGSSGDASSANTVYGAKAYAAGLASNYATSTQGGYADSALQSISKGTDGTYVTTTVGSKSGNNGAKTQTVGVAVTIQTISSADNSHKGLAEASDVKSYVDSVVAAGINYRGSVNNYTALLAVSNPSGGDMYNVKNDETITNVLYPGDMNYVYVAPVGTQGQSDYVAGFWDPTAPTINLSTATTTQIDGLFT